MVCIGVALFLFQSIFFISCIKWLSNSKKKRDREFAILDKERAKLIEERKIESEKKRQKLIEDRKIESDNRKKKLLEDKEAAQKAREELKNKTKTE
jgi:hypothetical protein